MARAGTYSVTYSLLPVNLTGRQMVILQSIWQPWFNLLPQHEVCAAVAQLRHSHKPKQIAIKHFLQKLKIIMLQAIEGHVQAYLRDKIDGTGWMPLRTLG